MAQTALRLRRAAFSLSTILLPSTRHTPTAAVTIINTLSSAHVHTPFPPTLSRRHFHSTHLLSLSSASRSFNEVDKIDPDTILFEGCDYKHWLIVMSFGKDPSQYPPPEQMVETYVQTCAKVLGSVEEAKRRIYACSTTTYTGFQVEMDEETSQKFEGCPGVIFVLPDSYIDPVNKEYGGDKYVNGVIIPRPPPVQYGRTRRGDRQIDRRSRDPMPNQQGNPGYNQLESVPRDGGRYMPQPQGPQQRFPQQQNYPSQQNYSPQQTYPPQENYGTYGQRDRVPSMPSSTHHPGGGREGYQGGRTNNLPPHQGNYNHGYNYSQGQMSNSPSPQGGYTPQGQFNNYSEGHGFENPQGQTGNRPGGHGGYTPQGQMGIARDNSNYTSTHGAGAYGNSAGPYRPGPDGSSSQGAGTGFGVGHMPHGENERLPHASYEQSNTMDHRNHMPGMQTGFSQGRN